MGRFNCVCEMLASHMHIWSQFWGDAGGIVQVHLHESKIRVQNIYFSLNFLFICSQICLCLFNAFLLWHFLVKSHYDFVFTWTLEGSPSTLVCWTCCKPSENIPNRGEACRIMPREQCWPFLNCEITQAELGMLWKTDVVYTQKHLKCLKGTPGILSH